MISFTVVTDDDTSADIAANISSTHQSDRIDPGKRARRWRPRRADGLREDELHVLFNGLGNLVLTSWREDHD